MDTLPRRFQILDRRTRELIAEGLAGRQGVAVIRWHSDHHVINSDGNYLLPGDGKILRLDSEVIEALADMVSGIAVWAGDSRNESSGPEEPALVTELRRRNIEAGGPILVKGPPLPIDLGPRRAVEDSEVAFDVALPGRRFASEGPTDPSPQLTFGGIL